ncbi:MAG TPA: Asp23/Gls24 family envelope stress response protein [Candidatus Limnocylindrales bacterium]|nr:Asp23/Gls24 family envelope stress response protein [Candidatus Limnocylindrales bacterium]
MTHDPTPGRSLVTKRAIRDLVRTAVLSSYGVTGFATGGPFGRMLERLGLVHPGIHLEIEPELVVDLRITVAYGLPIAEVARQVESSVRYTLHHALEREPDRVSIRIGKLVHQHAMAPAPAPAPSEPATSDLAASGTDVA